MVRPRLRDIGVMIGNMAPGPYNAITDVPGVKVGHVTLIEGYGPLVPGKGPVRTGVTAIIPHEGNLYREKVPAAVHVINGYGKSMGLAQVTELGNIETPILLTNTLNVGLVADALIEYMLEQNPEIGVAAGTVNPIVGECNDGYLNDIRGRHVRHEHVFQALRTARSGPVPEGAVGAGTGMSAFEFKGGIGTSSRALPAELGGFTVGILVLSNFGYRGELKVDGIPVGLEIAAEEPGKRDEDGSIMVVLATDAPLSSRQLLRVAKRAGIGIARTGSTAAHGSGDFVIAFSTANREYAYPDRMIYASERIVEDGKYLMPFFQAAIDATEEAIINSVFRAETVTGRDNHRRLGIPIDQVVEILRKHHRI